MEFKDLLTGKTIYYLQFDTRYGWNDTHIKQVLEQKKLPCEKIINDRHFKTIYYKRIKENDEIKEQLYQKEKSIIMGYK